MRYLTAEEAKRVYDRSSRWRKSHAFYVRRALDELIARGDFEHATSVFEFGCGTGVFAARLLERHLPESSRYLGIDVSPNRVRRTRESLQPWPGRAEARVADGSMRLPIADGEFDRVVSNYVLDLLSPEDAVALVSEAHRGLAPAGKLCLTGLTFGSTALSRAVMLIWEGVWSLRPEIVGGCRPVECADYLSPAQWEVDHRSVVNSFGISSEVVVAHRRVVQQR